MIITYNFRIKDSNCKNRLLKMASSVNFVWNYCNEVSIRSITYNSKWLSGFDLSKLAAGCSKELKIHGQTIQSVCEEYAGRRKQFKKIKMKWRSKNRARGWIPFKNQSIVVHGDSVIYRKQIFRFWHSRKIEGIIKSGSFNQDSRGRWYLNLHCEIIEQKRIPSGKIVGIDLGLKSMVTTSDGEILNGGKFYRAFEEKLAIAQRANKTKHIKSIHAKIVNSRRDELHKESTRLVKIYDQIFIGNVKSKKLIKTKMAKSVLDAGWAKFRSILEYKATKLGVGYEEVNEMFSSVTCSNCFLRSGPNGLSGLGVRTWECSNCHAHHDRDVNAAINILMFGLGHQTPIKGIELALANQGCQKAKDETLVEMLS